jgi:hypothetical protein
MAHVRVGKPAADGCVGLRCGLYGGGGVCHLVGSVLLDLELSLCLLGTVDGLEVFDRGLDLCRRRGSERYWNDIFSEIFNLTILQNERSEYDGVNGFSGAELDVCGLGRWECLWLDILEMRGDGTHGGSRTSGGDGKCEVRHGSVEGAIVIVLRDREHSRLGSGRQRMIEW